MQVKAITVNAASLAPEWSVQTNRTQAQTENSSMFGPECRVTISQEGRNLSSQQAVQGGQDTADVKEVREQLRQMEKTQSVETQKTQSSNQEEYVGLKKSIADMYKEMGYYGDELRELTESSYEKYCKAYPAGHGGIQQIPFEDPTEEEIAAMNERARQSKENMDKILKSLTPADLAKAIPLKFDYYSIN